MQRPSTTIVIAKLTFREASRRWVLWVTLLLGLMFLIVYGLGFREILKELPNNTSRLQRSEFTSFIMLAGLYAVSFLTLIMTVLTSVDTLSGEITSGTIHTLVSKPLRRWEIILGKWLGFMSMLTLYLLLMAGGVLPDRLLAVRLYGSECLGWVGPDVVEHQPDAVGFAVRRGFPFYPCKWGAGIWTVWCGFYRRLDRTVWRPPE
jgi:hypothetical protein